MPPSPVSPHLIISFVAPSSHFLGLLFAWFSSVSPRVRHLVISGNLLACRSSLRPAFRHASRPSSRSLLDDVIDSLLNRSTCRSACGHQSPRPACRVAGSGTGRGAYLVIVRPPCRRCLLTRAWDVCVCSDCGDLLAYSVGGSICVGSVLAKLYI